MLILFEYILTVSYSLIANLGFVFQEVSKFINHCNEMKAVTIANKDGGYLSIVKSPTESSSGGGGKK